MALRFLAAADETFSLLASQPNIGWHARLRTPALGTLRMFRVAGFERMLILYRPLEDGVDILRIVTRLPQAAGALAPAGGNRVNRRPDEQAGVGGFGGTDVSHSRRVGARPWIQHPEG